MVSNQSSLGSCSRSDRSSPQQASVLPPRRRGKSRGKGLGRRFIRNGGRRFPVSMPEDARVAVGQHAAEFTSELSLLVKQYAPLTVSKWRFVPQERKDKIYREVQKRFEVENGDDEETKDMVMEKANKMYRDWRYKLGQVYKKYTTDAARKANIPDRVETEAWNELINWFASPAFQAVSNCNKVTRSNQGVTQTTGRTSFQSKRYSKVDLETGKLPNNLDLWVMTHQKPSGEWGDELSQTRYQKMLDLTKESEDGSSARSLSPDEAILQVLGSRSGHVRGQGCGPRASKASGMQARAERAEQERDELRVMVSDIGETLNLRVQAAIQDREAEQREHEEARIKAIVEATLAGMVRGSGQSACSNSNIEP